MVRYSFIIPSYNNIEGLIQCLSAISSCKNPDNIPYEVLVIDDGSTDGTYEYVTSTYSASTVRCLRLLRTSKSSRGRARNAGIREATGQIVNFIDSDILVSEQHIIELEKFFSYNMDIVLVGNRTFRNRSQPDQQPNGHSDFRYQIYLNQSFNVNAINYPWAVSYSCNLSISYARILETGGFDEKFVSWGLEDLELGYRLFESGLRICFNPNLTVDHIGNDSRCDLLTESDRLEGYKRNIGYFIEKHSLTSQYPMEDFYTLLTRGERLCHDLISTIGDHSIFTNGIGGCSNLKANVDTALLNGKKIVLLDLDANSDLVVWVHFHQSAKMILYFPMNFIGQPEKELLIHRLKRVNLA